VPLVDLDSFIADPKQDSMLPKRTRKIPQQVRDLIERDLVAYRHRLCTGDHSNSTSVHMLAGVEIVTGITDAVIKNICKNCTQSTSISDIVSFGVNESQAADILTILKLYIHSC
jgi:hypothetical protein